MKRFLGVIISLSAFLLLLTACADGASFAPTTEGSGRVAVYGDDLKAFDLKTYTVSSDGSVEWKLADMTITSTGTYTVYLYKNKEQHDIIQKFITNGRQGTLTPLPLHQSGYIVFVGYNKTEMHYADDITRSSDGEWQVNLQNGMAISTNVWDFVSIKYDNEKQRVKALEQFAKQ
jgi:hypothetical protein